MLHAGRALPPLQKANGNYRDWVSDSSFLPATSPTATELPHTDRAPAASLSRIHLHRIPQRCRSLLPRGHQGTWGAFVTQPSTTRRLERWRSRGASRLPSLCTQKAAAAGQGDGTGCPAPWDTPAHAGDGTGPCRWVFVDAIGINHGLSQLNKCWIPPGSPPWLSPRRFPFPLILGETIHWSIPVVFSHDPVRDPSSSRCPSASTQPLPRCPASPVGPVLVQGHLE